MTSTFVIVSLLFSQLALANYVCPAAGPVSAMPAGGAPCEGMDPAAPVLCHQYANDASQSFELAKAPTPTLPIVVQVIVLPTPLDSSPATARTIADRPELRPPPDPLFLQTLRLRV